MPSYRDPEKKKRDKRPRIHLQQDTDKTRCGLKLKKWMRYPQKNVTLDPEKITCAICRRSLMSPISRKEKPQFMLLTTTQR